MDKSGQPGRYLLWADLSAEQLQHVRQPPRKNLTSRDVLAHITALDPGAAQDALILDLYVHTLQFAQAQDFSADQTSTLFSIVKEVHGRATADKLPITVAFGYLRQVLLTHSVQRPPFSLGIFSLARMQCISDWMVASYFRHYKLYQYAFTPRVSLRVTSQHPLQLIEVPFLLPPLSDAMTEAQYEVELQFARQEAEAQAVAAAAAAAHEVHLRELTRDKEEYEASIPDEIKGRVAEAVQAQMVILRQALQDEYAAAADAAKLAVEQAAAQAADELIKAGKTKGRPAAAV